MYKWLHCVEKYGIFIVESEHVITVEVCRTGFFKYEVYSQRKALFYKFRTEFYNQHKLKIVHSVIWPDHHNNTELLVTFRNFNDIIARI
jgi:hypothetical protein